MRLVGKTGSASKFGLWFSITLSCLPRVLGELTRGFVASL